MSVQIENPGEDLVRQFTNPTFDAVKLFSDRSFSVAQIAYYRLRFRIAVVISTFQVSEWQLTQARKGLHLPCTAIDGYVFPPYHMCHEEREWIATDAGWRKTFAREGLDGFFAPQVVKLIETHAIGRRQNAYLLAWNVMVKFVEVFEPLHSILVHELGSAHDNPEVMPDLASTMLNQRQETPAWCLIEPVPKSRTQ